MEGTKNGGFAVASTMESSLMSNLAQNNDLVPMLPSVAFAS